MLWKGKAVRPARNLFKPMITEEEVWQKYDAIMQGMPYNMDELPSMIPRAMFDACKARDWSDITILKAIIVAQESETRRFKKALINSEQMRTVQIFMDQDGQLQRKLAP